jgi:hypothetical protein
MKPKLEKTYDYSRFEMHDHNRALHDNDVLLESMQKHGFMPSSPIHCVQNGSGKYKIIRGHHRFSYAKRLKLPVYYVLDNSNTNIFDLEGSALQAWSVKDFAVGYARSGHKDIATLLAFKQKHGLTLLSAASLLGGESAGSGNKVKSVKSGKFKLGDTKHATQLVAITDLCREQQIPFATATTFVNALSMALRVPEFDQNIFMHRIRTSGTNLRRRSKVEDYLDEIEALYNYGAKAKRLPLKFKAIELSRQRKETFGGKIKQKS